MKKTLSLLLATLMLTSSVLIGCSDTSADSTDTSAPADSTSEAETTTAETELTDGLEDKNMDGFEFKIYNSTPESLSWAEVRLSVEETDGDILNEAIYERNLYIEERFKTKLVNTSAKWDEIAKQYATLVSSGDNAYDIIMAYGVRTGNLIDYVADFNQVPYVALDKDWWNPTASETFHIGGKRFAAAGNFSLSYASTANLLMFNKNLYTKMNTGEDLYKLVRDGKWTVDKFLSTVVAGSSDLNGDGKFDANDQYGIGGTVKALHHMLVIGSGMKYVTLDKDNFPIFKISSNEKMVNFLEKIVNFHIANPNAYSWPSTVDSDSPVLFDTGKDLFYVAWPHNLTKYREMEDDFGVIPAPKYDEAQEKYYANMANGEVATLPRSYDKARLDNIGILLEAMSFYTHQEVIPIYKDVVLDLKVTRDSDSAEMLDIVFAGITYDYGINVWQTEIGNKLMKEIIFNKSNAIVSYLTSIEPTLDATIANIRTSVEAIP